VVTQQIVSEVNKMGTTWKASTSQGWVSQLTKEEAKGLCGSIRNGPYKLPQKTFASSKINIPDEFDSRVNWVRKALLFQ
jgi:hypothetical protein